MIGLIVVVAGMAAAFRGRLVAAKQAEIVVKGRFLNTVLDIVKGLKTIFVFRD